VPILSTVFRIAPAATAPDVVLHARREDDKNPSRSGA
jgi:hypothetical protein